MIIDGVTHEEQCWLEYVDAGERNGYDGMYSGRLHRKRTAERLCERGLLRPREDLQPADGDGHIQWNRAPRLGYSLTAAGRAVLRLIADQEPGAPRKASSERV